MKLKKLIKQRLCKHTYKIKKSECEEDVTVRVCSKCKKKWAHRHQWAYLR